MSRLATALDDHLTLRHSLGHELDEAHRLLPSLVAYLEMIGAKTVTVEAALAWAKRPDADPSSSVWPRRMTAARGFARYLVGIDPDTEIPPLGLIPSHQRWRPPYVYSDDEIVRLMARAKTMRAPLPAATYETFIGLLAATGMRVGEVIRLDRHDVDWEEGVIEVHRSKFGKSRQVPMLADTLAALRHYSRRRDVLCRDARSPSFFVSGSGGRLVYGVVSQGFRRLRDQAGVGIGAPNPPRIHDLRHSFAVRVLLEWHRAGADVEGRLPALSTYLGHRDPRSTYWYLSAAPELLALAASRLEPSRGMVAR